MTRHYSGGKKYCSRCRGYFRTEGWRCPYCHSVMRDSPRQRRDKERRTVLRIDPSKYLSINRDVFLLNYPVSKDLLIKTV
jgi:hypothetical protein